MENKEIRRANLDVLIERSGSIRALADAVGTAPNYLSEIKNRVRDMGDRLARKVETALDLEAGWMDRQHESTESAPGDAKESGKYIAADSIEDLARQLAKKENEDVAKIIELLLKIRSENGGH